MCKCPSSHWHMLSADELVLCERVHALQLAALPGRVWSMHTLHTSMHTLVRPYSSLCIDRCLQDRHWLTNDTVRCQKNALTFCIGF